MNLGRYQAGMSVPLAVACVAASTPVMPDAAPVAAVAGPDSATVLTVKLAYSGTPGGFGLPLFLDVRFAALGTYTVSYSYGFHEGAGSGTAADTFDVIAGGDPGGAVISMFSIDRPEATYVVAQLASGRLVQGRNPRL